MRQNTGIGIIKKGEKMIKIIADSVSDLNAELQEEYGITVVPLTVNIGKDSYLDMIEINQKRFFEILEADDKISPKTAAPTPEAYKQVFQEEIEKGNSVICFTVSSASSSSCQSATIAKEMIGKGKIDIIDTKTAGLGEGINAIEAAKLAKAGVAHEEIVQQSLQRVEKMQTIVLMDTMEYLKRGGRISAAKAKLASLLNIKPIIQYMPAKGGEIDLIHRARGFKNGMKWLTEYAKSLRADMSKITLGIAYANDKSELEQFLDMLKRSISFQKVIVAQIGCVVGSHVGPGGVGIFFETV